MSFQPLKIGQILHANTGEENLGGGGGRGGNYSSTFKGGGQSPSTYYCLQQAVTIYKIIKINYAYSTLTSFNINTYFW